MTQHLRIRPLYNTGLVTVTDVSCRVSNRACGHEELPGANEIVFLRAGSFMKHQGPQRVFADPNQAIFFNRVEPYRVSHPVSGGDECTVLRFDDQTLCEVFGSLGQISDPSPDAPFQAASLCPIPAGVSFQLQKLRRDLLAETHEALAVEELSLQILQQVATSTSQRLGQPPQAKGRTSSVHAELANAVRILLASTFHESLSLAALAQRFGVSPFHLARVFQTHTGYPLHQYRMRLRLAAALQRLTEGARDLTELALDLGYSSHSHLTDSFRQAFGIPPSAFRRKTAKDQLRKMSKILEA